MDLIYIVLLIWITKQHYRYIGNVFPKQAYGKPQNIWKVASEPSWKWFIYASFNGRTRTRTVQHPNMEKTILNTLNEIPHRPITHYIHASQPNIWGVLNEEYLHLFHIQSPSFASNCPLCIEFCHWFFAAVCIVTNFSSYVLFTNEVTFAQGSVFNIHNTHV